VSSPPCRRKSSKRTEISFVSFFSDLRRSQVNLNSKNGIFLFYVLSIFFNVVQSFDLRRPQVEQKPTCDGIELSHVFVWSTCGRRKSTIQGKLKNIAKFGHDHVARGSFRRRAPGPFCQEQG